MSVARQVLVVVVLFGAWAAPPEAFGESPVAFPAAWRP
eukprot:CAMPEP_0170349736 /NCGR_PEP_ID=MMETSP0116_2-20130129/76158_1 /TAXON_ID=400756 /ORGANISM="Durinskia baltica, Strain CSIRO CS-38" /LENGTH=37 /DNA_ID= /DNA_START= /DNA_END= /DNA_ORIENTATION=